MTNKQAFWQGVKEVQALTLSSMPFAALLGAVCLQFGLDYFQSLLSSMIVFAGISQLVMIDLLSKEVPVFTVALTACVINLRFVLYSANLSLTLKGESKKKKILFGYGISDQAFATLATRLTTGSKNLNIGPYFWGAVIFFWIEWHIGFAIGLSLGHLVPSWLSLEFAFSLTFLAVLIANVIDRHTLLAAVVGALLAVVANGLPLNLGLFVGVFGGVAIGYYSESRHRRKQNQKGVQLQKKIEKSG